MWENIPLGMSARSNTENALLFKRVPGLQFELTKSQSVNTSFTIWPFS
jgi:hypothetical protein